MSDKEVHELRHLAELRRVLLGAERLKVEYLRQEVERLKRAVTFWECEHVCLGDDSPNPDPREYSKEADLETSLGDLF